MSVQRQGIQHNACEWSFASGYRYDDPFNEVSLDVEFTHQDGQTWRVPAYWAGDQEWRVRFAPPLVGDYSYRSLASDPTDLDLHGQTGRLHVEPYRSTNPLLIHGPLMTVDGDHLEHQDGTPFFWLGDTWWLSLCRRLSWPDDFQLLTADRVAKGFSVIQLVAGLYPDVPAYDERGFNEAGHPWEADYARINPAYFDMADLRIRWLVHAGLVPCIVACWGYHLPWLGVEKIKAHWRNLVARYGAYPVVWCLAGEAAMPYYLAEDKQSAQQVQKQGWTEVGRYLREIDPYHHPVTIHPTDAGRDQVLDDSILDLDMLQTGHSGYKSIPNTLRAVKRAVVREPHKSVIQGEVCYEGILEGSREEIQRYMFWACMLSGCAGFTYGANGIWQVNTEDAPFGPSPHGASWGNRPWREAYQLPGSRQVGLGKQLLQRYDWWRMRPHPEWVSPAATVEDPMQPLAAGIAGEVRVFYLPTPIGPWSPPITVEVLDALTTYRAFFFDPVNGTEVDLGDVSGQNTWRIPQPPIIQDWVLVLETVPPT